MRLLRLKVRNIASLKGEHEVDFLEIQRQSTLFAITGETGSGKSSILNCIGLALYGQIYKKNVNQLDVVTLGEKEGSIELIFQVKGKYYLADWRAKVRKQNGELYSTPQTPSRNLYTLEEPEFNSAKNIATVSAPELLNLDFDQFTKCIILNQGEFAKFLTSSFTDRKDILEKLYPGELLESMGRELKLELDSLQSEKHDIEIKLGELKGNTLSGEELKEQKKSLEAELKRLEATSKNLEELDYHFVSLNSYFEKYLDNEKKKEIIKKDLVGETTKYNLILKNGEEIAESYQKALKVQETELPALQLFLQKEETLKNLQDSHQNIQKRSVDLLKNLSDLETRILSKDSENRDASTKLSESESILKFPLKALKEQKANFNPLFDLFGENEIKSEELKGKRERLSQLELTGKELKMLIETKEANLKLIPENIKDLEKDLEKKKLDLTAKADKKQRAEIKAQELKKQIELAQAESASFMEQATALKLLIEKTNADLLPLEAALRLQEVLNASEICVDHAIKNNADHCPVCERETAPSVWGSLKEKLQKTDLKSIREKFDIGSKVIIQSSREEELYQTKIKAIASDLTMKDSELKMILVDATVTLATSTELDQELDKLKKQSWEADGLKKEIEAKKLELQKFRDEYAKLKNEITNLESEFNQKQDKISILHANIKTFIPELNRDAIRDLKLEVKKLESCLELEAKLEKIVQEKSFLTEQKTKLSTESEAAKKEESILNEKIKALSLDLAENLKGEKASVLISKIHSAVNTAREANDKHIKELKDQETAVKTSQVRINQIDEQNKDNDLLFTKELHLVREISSKNDKPEINRLKELTLDFKSPPELFGPLKDLIKNEKDTSKNLANECRMNFASVSTKLADWEKLQDKIQLLELKFKDVNDALSRKLRLFEVLGKDELRTFVLSLVEENLILQTNDELQKLCQGRYEIVHQTKSMKMSPEFFILDKFREGGKRKVSTLSGGETFMVSLAMALGLAEMTRGQAEIDSLFIDEGFGTLDQDSLEDVLDMLNQIQTRGLMVGVISHIKTLTQAIPVNLVLNKRQDGTSTISMQVN